MAAVELSESTNVWLWICMRSDIYWLDVILFRALWGGGNKGLCISGKSSKLLIILVFGHRIY